MNNDILDMTEQFLSQGKGQVESSQPTIRILPHLSPHATAHSAHPITVILPEEKSLTPAEYRRRSKGLRKAQKIGRKAGRELRKGRGLKQAENGAETSS